MTSEPHDVGRVPLDRSEAKRRPALVFSKASFNRHGHTMLAMITSAGHHPWPGDTAVTQQEAAGLQVPCVVRLKVFTLDNRLIAQVIGRLAAADRKAVGESLRRYVV